MAGPADEVPRQVESDQLTVRRRFASPHVTSHDCSVLRCGVVTVLAKSGGTQMAAGTYRLGRRRRSGMVWPGHG